MSRKKQSEKANSSTPRRHSPGRAAQVLRFLRRNKKPLALRLLLLLVVAAFVGLLVFAAKRFHDVEVQTQALLDQETAELNGERVNHVYPAHAYQAGNFVANGDFMTYADENYFSMQGIDVSDHNGEIDWARVKAAGIQFAFLRVGYRGYTEGAIHEDAQFAANAAGCTAQDIPVGVYFFSQALNEEEAKEEAQFVISQLQSLSPALNPSLPVVYDPEDAPSENARTTGLSGEQITKNALAFMEEIRKAGYVPAIYANEQWQNTVLDMTQFTDTITWFAGFSQVPHSQYHFEYWQYKYQGHVDGIDEDTWVDMDIRFLPVSG